MYLNRFVLLCKQIMNAFYVILTFHFQYQILCACELANLNSETKSSEMSELTQVEIFSIFKHVHILRLNLKLLFLLLLIFKSVALKNIIFKDEAFTNILQMIFMFAT